MTVSDFAKSSLTKFATFWELFTATEPFRVGPTVAVGAGSTLAVLIVPGWAEVELVETGIACSVAQPLRKSVPVAKAKPTTRRRTVNVLVLVDQAVPGPEQVCLTVIPYAF